MRKYYCLYCGWNCNPEFWETKIGKRWVCKSCGNYGLCGDYGEPQFLTEDSQDVGEPDADFCKRIFKEKQ